jgi:hypothetical protein
VIGEVAPALRELGVEVKEIISADAPVSSRASESVTERLYPDDDTILEANTLHEPIRPEVIRPDLDGN